MPHIHVPRAVRRPLVLFCAVLLAACSGGGSSPPVDPGPGLGERPVPLPLAKAKLQAFDSCDSLRGYIADSLTTSLLSPVFVDFALAEPASGAPVGAEGGDAAGGVPDDVSRTNTQEAGVDEADIIKADSAGNFYVLSGRVLSVIDGFPAEQMSELARLELGEFGYGSVMFLDEPNARLMVIVNGGGFGFAPQSFHGRTELISVDISEPAAPQISRRRVLEGQLISARRIGERVHVVTGFAPAYPQALNDQTFWEQVHDYFQARNAEDQRRADQLAGQIADQVRAAVAAEDLAALLPRVDDGPPLDCAAVAAPEVGTPHTLTVLHSLDTDGGDLSSAGVFSNAWVVYASEQSLYLVQNSGGWWFNDLQTEQTAIHKFSLGAGAPVYRATGLIDGWAQSSFNLSEAGNDLRVASHLRSRSEAGTELSNQLVVLRDDGVGNLRETGAMRGFGPGEDIFAVRFLGERAYVVTFRRIDPLFVFDLSDGSNPQLLGEAEIPGFSTYIHPLDDETLLTVGRAGDLDGNIRGVQLSLFDVSNPAAPVQRFTAELEASGWSPAEYDHHAFAFDGASGTLSLPLRSYNDADGQEFGGFVVYRVDPAAGFTELGRIDHGAIAREYYCGAPPEDAIYHCEGVYYLQAADPRRTVFVRSGEQLLLYSISDIALIASGLADLQSPVAELALPPPEQAYWVYPQGASGG